MRDLFKKVTEWLAACPVPAFDFEGFELTVLGESKALAVRYSQTIDAGTPREYTDTSYYVVAPLPKRYRHGTERKNGSELFGAGKAFYVACYFPEGYVKEEHKKFHPFGPSYILREIADLSAHRIPGELPHRIPAEFKPLTTEGE